PKEHIQELTWPEVHSLYHEGHENVLAVIDLIVTLPASSSANELGFGQMKLTKTSIRSRLCDATLNNSIAIQMLTPDLGSVEVVEHTAAILKPAAQQNVPVEQDEEAEEEVIFSEKRDDDFGDDVEGVVSEYESDPEITEEIILQKLDKL
ncbi:hypothetical protein pdam_00024850, partial [Pocillopora damicornis]